MVVVVPQDYQQRHYSTILGVSGGSSTAGVPSAAVQYRSGSMVAVVLWEAAVPPKYHRSNTRVPNQYRSMSTAAVLHG